MCGLMLAFVVAAALWQRRHGGAVARVDFSMIEAMLWTMAEPLLATQLTRTAEAGAATGPSATRRTASGAAPATMPGSALRSRATRNGGRCARGAGVGDDAGLGVARARASSGRRSMTRLPRGCGRSARRHAAAALMRAGIPAAALATSRDLVESPHLRARGFWDEPHGAGVLPGLPWRASFGRQSGAAPELGADTDRVLTDVLGLSGDDVAALRRSGALG